MLDNIIEACIGVLGIQDICHFTSRDIRYFPFYFQDTGYYVQFQGYCYFSSKINKHRVEIDLPIISIKIVSSFLLRFISTGTFRQSITCSVNALVIYSLAKDVEGGRGDSILYIVDSIRIKLPYPLLDFPQTCVVFCVESLIVFWCGYCPF